MKIYREKIGEINDRLNAIEAREKEISERAKAIKAELEGCQDDAVINERKTETEKLTAERASLETEKTGLESEKDELIRKNDEETKRNAMTGIKFTGENNMTITERRERFFNELRNGKLSLDMASLTFKGKPVRAGSDEALKMRAMLPSAVPYATGAGDFDETHLVVPSLVDFVRKQNLPDCNNQKIPYSKLNELDFTQRTPGQEIAEDDVETGMVELPACELDCTTDVDNEVLDNPNADAESIVMDALQESWRAKVADRIVNGLASNKFYGIINAADVEGNSMIDSATLSALDENTLTSLCLGTNGSADQVPGSGLLILTREQLHALGKIRGANKNSVFTITRNNMNENIGSIAEGGNFVNFVLCSKLPANTMLYGKGLAYTLNLYSDLKITFSREAKFTKNLTVFKAMGKIGGNVTRIKSWTKVTVTPSTGK